MARSHGSSTVSRNRAARLHCGSSPLDCRDSRPSRCTRSSRTLGRDRGILELDSGRPDLRLAYAYARLFDTEAGDGRLGDLRRERLEQVVGPFVDLAYGGRDVAIVDGVLDPVAPTPLAHLELHVVDEELSTSALFRADPVMAEELEPTQLDLHALTASATRSA